MPDDFDTQTLQLSQEVIAPDGSIVRPLCRISGQGSFAHFSLRPGEVAKAVRHATVHEIWYVIEGTGRIFRRQDDREEIVDLRRGVCLTIPVGTEFQFRADANSHGNLQIVAVTMPPWPANSTSEATSIQGPWQQQ